MKHAMTKNLKPEMFKDVVMFSISERYAMGPNGTISVLLKNGDYYEFDYLSKETPYERIKEYFVELNGCYWNGPMKGEGENDSAFVIGATSSRSTKIPEGFAHYYLEFGNHLLIKEKYDFDIMEILKNQHVADITFDWYEMINKSGYFENKLK